VSIQDAGEHVVMMNVRWALCRLKSHVNTRGNAAGICVRIVQDSRWESHRDTLSHTRYVAFICVRLSLGADQVQPSHNSFIEVLVLELRAKTSLL
jgi:hypothetical protein